MLRFKNILWRISWLQKLVPVIHVTVDVPLTRTPKLFLLLAVPRALALVSQAGATNTSEAGGGTTRPCKQTGMLFASSDDFLLTEVEKSALPQTSLSVQAVSALCCPTSCHNHGRHPAAAQTYPAVPQCPTRLMTLSFSYLTQPCAVVRIDLRLSPRPAVGRNKSPPTTEPCAPLGTHARLARIALLADDHLLDHHLCIAVC